MYERNTCKEREQGGSDNSSHGAMLTSRRRSQPKPTHIKEKVYRMHLTRKFLHNDIALRLRLHGCFGCIAHVKGGHQVQPMRRNRVL